MSARRFVSGSSILLAAWLGATFFNDVSPKSYPKLDRSAAAAAKPAPKVEDPTAINAVVVPAPATLR